MDIPLVLPQLDEIKTMLVKALEKSATAEWYTLEQAYVAKYGNPEYGPSINTIKSHNALQPRGGTPDGWQQSRKAWKRETVERWAKVDDTTLLGYLAEVSPGVRIPAFIEKSISRRPSMEIRA